MHATTLLSSSGFFFKILYTPSTQFRLTVSKDILLFFPICAPGISSPAFPFLIVLARTSCVGYSGTDVGIHCLVPSHGERMAKSLPLNVILAAGHLFPFLYL